jgi:DNA-binding MarR family transcriptional regulator
MNDNEQKIIEGISRSQDLTQRELSKRTKLSLGAVNVILKRLARRGVVKTTNLNPRKVEYILTPKGFAEKAKKSYNYVLKTVNLVKMVKEEIAKIVLDEYNRGRKKFIILGNDDLADIIELALKGFDYERVNSLNDIKDKKALVLKGRSKLKTNNSAVIDISERLKDVSWGVEN